MNDLACLVPSQITVVYPATGTGAPASGYYPVNVTLQSLDIPQYAGIIGTNWAKVLHRYEQAVHSGSSTPDNDAQLVFLANRFAEDWYVWQLARLDQQHTGVLVWEPEGMHDLEWRDRFGLFTTRIQRGPFNPLEDLLIPSVASIPSNGGGGGGNICGDAGTFNYIEDVRCEGGTRGIVYKFTRTSSLLYEDGCLRLNLGGLSKAAIGCMDCTCVASGTGPSGGTGTGPTGTGGSGVCTGIPCLYCNSNSTPTGFDLIAGGFDCSVGNPPEGIKTPCYVNAIPRTLTVVFGGALSILGSITFTYSDGAFAWVATIASDPCGPISAIFICDGTNFGLFMAADEIQASLSGSITGSTWNGSGPVTAQSLCAETIGGVSPYSGTGTATINLSGSTSGPGTPNGAWRLIQSGPCTWTAFNATTQIQAILYLEEDAISDSLIWVFQFIDMRSGHHAILVEYRLIVPATASTDCGRTITLIASLPNYCTTSPNTLTFAPRFDCASGSGGGGTGSCRNTHGDLCVTFSGALAPLGTVRMSYVSPSLDTLQSGLITACGVSGYISFACTPGRGYELLPNLFVSSTNGPVLPDSLSPFQWHLNNTAGNNSGAPGCPGTFGAVVTECP